MDDDIRIRSHLSRHGREAFFQRKPTVVSFEFERDGRIEKRTSYFINERGESRKIGFRKYGLPRYLIRASDNITTPTKEK